MSECVVLIEQGRLNGKICTNYTGKSYYSFQGIPYAKAPLDELRFKAPVEPEQWEGIRSATEEKPGCYAHHIYFPNVVGSEDCLYLNVYTPELQNDNATLKPVIICFHGGGFLRGSGSTEFFGPDFLINHDIVLVTFNYRVGILGFLNLKDPDLGVPGNAGLKDQLMVLKWVQKNIKQFGGDTNNVTLLGFSAGAASVHYLMLSPLTRGLFHRAICHSLSALSEFAQGSNYSEELIDLLKLDKKNEASLLERLRKLPVEKLLEIQDSIKSGDASCKKPFAPIIETKSTEPAIITEQPIDIILSGRYNQLPLIMGHTSNEGLLFLPLLKLLETNEINDYETFIPYTLNISKGSKQSLNIAKKIQTFYEEHFKDVQTRNYTLRGDLLANIGVHKAAKLHAKNSNVPIYFYVFCLETKLNMYKEIMKIDTPGASHADDFGYLFKTKYTPVNLKNTMEESYMKNVIELWVNFARYGNPNGLDEVFWEPIDKDNFYYFNLDKEFECRKDSINERINFWNQILN